MTVKEHYDLHLGHFYSWMLGDFDIHKNAFREFCIEHNLKPFESGLAIDLGAGHGIQSVGLAELGFKVVAIDFNDQLLKELDSVKNEMQINSINGDITDFSQFVSEKADLISCCGDTISHLDSSEEISRLIGEIYNSLNIHGKLVLSFRDYSMELNDTSRFIPVKSDSNRIMNCFLEYFENKVRVTDLLIERSNNEWKQSVSSYMKVRLSERVVVDNLMEYGFRIVYNNKVKGLISLIAQK